MPFEKGKQKDIYLISVFADINICINVTNISYCIPENEVNKSYVK